MFKSKRTVKIPLKKRKKNCIVFLFFSKGAFRTTQVCNTPSENNQQDCNGLFSRLGQQKEPVISHQLIFHWHLHLALSPFMHKCIQFCIRKLRFPGVWSEKPESCKVELDKKAHRFFSFSLSPSPFFYFKVFHILLCTAKNSLVVFFHPSASWLTASL